MLLNILLWLKHHTRGRGGGGGGGKGNDVKDIRPVGVAEQK